MQNAVKIAIDENLLGEVVKATGENNEGKAVEKALKVFLRRRAIEYLRTMAGKFQIEDTREQFDEAERRQQYHSQTSSY